MNHLAQIQVEFVKEARKWEDLTREQQQSYLKRHPGSKRRVNAKSTKSTSDIKPMTINELKKSIKHETNHKTLRQLKRQLRKMQDAKAQVL
jgi:hypothetical protein